MPEPVPVLGLVVPLVPPVPPVPTEPEELPPMPVEPPELVPAPAEPGEVLPAVPALPPEEAPLRCSRRHRSFSAPERTSQRPSELPVALVSLAPLVPVPELEVPPDVPPEAVEPAEPLMPEEPPEDDGVEDDPAEAPLPDGDGLLDELVEDGALVDPDALVDDGALVDEGLLELPAEDDGVLELPAEDDELSLDDPLALVLGVLLEPEALGVLLELEALGVLLDAEVLGELDAEEELPTLDEPLEALGELAPDEVDGELVALEPPALSRMQRSFSRPVRFSQREELPTALLEVLGELAPLGLDALPEVCANDTLATARKAEATAVLSTFIFM